MKVQFNPVEYHQSIPASSSPIGLPSSSSMGSSVELEDESEDELEHRLPNLRSSIKVRAKDSSDPTKSGSPTPRNSPKSARQLLDEFHHQRNASNSLSHSSAHSTLTRHQINQVVTQLQKEQQKSPGQGQKMQPTFEPRIVMPVMKKSGDLGVRLVSFLKKVSLKIHLKIFDRFFNDSMNITILSLFSLKTIGRWKRGRNLHSFGGD